MRLRLASECESNSPLGRGPVHGHTCAVRITWSMTGASQASKLPKRNEKTRVRIPAAAPFHPALLGLRKLLAEEQFKFEIIPQSLV